MLRWSIKALEWVEGASVDVGLGSLGSGGDMGNSESEDRTLEKIQGGIARTCSEPGGSELL